MKEEIRAFLTAVMFYTRIPCPPWIDHSDAYLRKSRKYFPLIGWIVGGVSASTLYVMQFFLPLNVSVLLCIIVGIFLTGAFHEDGFADVCDAFGGGFTRKRILEILKDSRVGAYGAIGITLMLLLKFTVLLEIANLDLKTACLVIIASHSISRLTALTIVFNEQYAGDLALSKSHSMVADPARPGEVVFSMLIGLSVLFLFNTWLLFLPLLSVLGTRIYLASFFRKWIGGYTGDCLGATQQISEIVFSTNVLILWKFIL